MDLGFVEGNSSNLPKVDIFTVGNYFASNNNFCASDFRNAKTSMSCSETYGDDAIGYVQLKREGTLCTVKCHVCPEHKIRTKPYAVTVVIDEQDNIVRSVQCHDCTESAGGCKHAVAFLMWLHRRSEEPSCTQVLCYWEESKLSNIAIPLKFILAPELAKKKRITNVPSFDSSVLMKFIDEARKRKVTNCEILKYQTNYSVDNDVEVLSLHQLVLNYREPCCATFMKKIQLLFTDDILKKIEISTRNRNKNYLWFELQYARMTASKAYEISRCKMADEALIATIMGSRVPKTATQKRGCILKDKVIKIVEKKIGKEINKCGLFISKHEPVIAGSPDGICGENLIIEIKCPINENTYNYYVKGGKVSKNCYAQVQIQMYVTGARKCFFCVAHCDYHNSIEVKIITVSFNPDYVIELVNSMLSFWNANIYPLLQTIAHGYESCE